MVPWLAEAITALDLARPHLVGHSLGARLALGLAESGVPAASLSLIACAGISPSYDFAFLARLASLASLEDALACAGRLLGGATLDRERFARTLVQKLSPAPAQAAMRHYLATNFAGGRLLPAAPIDWARVDCPVQLIWGRDDSVVEPPEAGFLPPRARLHWLDRVGHLPHVAAPDAVNRLLLEFCLAAAQPQVRSVAAQE